MNSEEGSLHSHPARLSPYPSRSAMGSVPTSHHTQTGSNSSRPSARSAGHSSGGHSLGATSSVSSYGHLMASRRVGEIGELIPTVASPPLSAVLSRPSASSLGHEQQPPATPQQTHNDDNSSSTSSNPFILPPIPRHTSLFPLAESDVSPSSSNMPLLGGVSGGLNTEGGTVASRDTNTNSSVTTTATDPITGARMHFPGMPWRTGEGRDRERGWGEADDWN